MASLQLFGRGTDNGVWTRWRNPDGSWSGWQSLGGVLNGDPQVFNLHFSAAHEQLLSGRYSCWQGKDPGWKLSEGTGDREFVERIAFPRRFEPPPQVAVGLTSLDVDREKNTRVAIEARNVDPEGFDLVFRTWSDTILHGAGADWVALGRVHV